MNRAVSLLFESIRTREENQAPRPSIGFILLLGCLLLALVLPVGAVASGEEEMPPGKIVFLPFTVKTRQPQTYLENGLTDVLATRLSSRTGLVAIHKTSETRKLAQLMEEGEQEAFKNILNRLQAEYLVIGSLEQRDTDFEIAVYVFDRKKGAPSSFRKTITGLNGAIPAMDAISTDIAASVFGKKGPEQLLSSTPEEQGTSAFQTAHPDRAYREGLYQPAVILGLDGDMYKVLATRRSNTIEASVRAMDVGDLDGNGQEEIVLVEHGKLAIYRFSADHFQHVADQDLPDHLAPHAVRLADLDHNGRLEIYITANNGDTPASQVFEWDGKDFQTLMTDIPYYLRPGLDRQGRPALIGQSGGSNGPAGRNFYILKRGENNTLERAAKLSMPRGFNLMDFIRADLDQDGSLEFIGITTANRMVVMNQDRETLWKSEAVYGASKDFLGTLSSNRSGGRTPIYMHTRLIARDEDGDGRPEIIIGRNRLANVKFFKRLRYFEGSSITALSWDDTEMSTLWETRKISGYTTDYQVVGSGNGRTRLFFVESDSSYPMFFWESESAVIHLYEMGKKQQDMETK